MTLLEKLTNNLFERFAIKKEDGTLIAKELESTLEEELLKSKKLYTILGRFDVIDNKIKFTTSRRLLDRLREKNENST